MSDLIKVPEYAKIKVYWDDRPENYSRESKLKIHNYFSKKYGINKNSINVIYRPVKIGKNGEVIEISGAGVDNIMDKNYQLELMKEWFKREGKTIDFKQIIALDNKVNGSLTSDQETSNHRSWELKWLFIDNFLCFGEKNFVSFAGLTGLNIVTSEPPNQGGKTTFSVDAIKFLLFGRTTKTEKNEQIFNTFTDVDKLVVRGMLNIDGEETILERKLSRSAKKSGGWTVINHLNYYRLLPDGTEDPLNEEDAKKTGEKIKNSVGSEKDFDITILATGRNLDDLIEAKPTESGRLLTKFIGLEVIEEKEAICKQFYSDFNKTKKGNMYNTVTLLSENNTHDENLILYADSLKSHKENLIIINEALSTLDKERDTLMNKKIPIDVIISQLNPEKIESDIKTITDKGVLISKNIDNLISEIKLIGDVTYDENLYHSLNKDFNSTTIAIGALKNDLEQYGKVIADLENSEMCQTCKRPLADIDNTKQIADYKNKIVKGEKSVKTHDSQLVTITEGLNKLKVNRELVDKRNRLELQKDKYEVEIEGLRNQIKDKKVDLKKYKTNEDAIKTNINIDADISAVKTNVVVKTTERDTVTQKLFVTETTIKTTNEKIVNNNKIIKALKIEEAVEKVYKVYLEMIGKKGISKLVLRSVLPIINSELIRLLDDICDFEIELEMTDKNDVEYNIIKSGVSKPLKSGSGLERTFSSLALRCVLGKISHLPTPNFITFDEILGTVAAENIEKLKPMFEKIRGMFDIVFFITHNDIVKDWGDNIIVVKKVDDISNINIK